MEWQTRKYELLLSFFPVDPVASHYVTNIIV